MLSVKNLKLAYKGITVVHGVDFQVQEGKITVLIGGNGAGKTSIVKAVMGLIKPVGGEITYQGKDLISVPPYKMSSIGISLCPEGRQLFPDMTIVENMEMGAFARNDKVKIKEDIEAILERFPRLKERRNQKAKTASGGEQELVAIARALIPNPKLLILDEPSWGLAPLMVEEVMQIIQDINRTSGTTILLIEQNANVALRYADYAYVLDVGVVAAEGTGEALLNDEQVQNIYLGT